MRPVWLAALIWLLACASVCAETSEFAPRAVHSLLLDLARAGDRIVAVGDRGHVLLSDDDGRSWRQVLVPTRAMLTAVSFGDARHGWAVGHDGVILATNDGGETWGRQDSGNELDSIWLDVLARSASACDAVGAYGLSASTTDRGATWRRNRPIEDELHYNAIASGPGGASYIAGEQGTLLVSRADRAAWTPADVNYDGSLFGVLPLSETSLLAFGLRGRVFLSEDGGETWSPRPAPVPVLIMCGARLENGAVVLGGLSGNIFISRDQGQSFQSWKPAAYNGGVASLLETNDGALLVAGELGVARLTLPEVAR